MIVENIKEDEAKKLRELIESRTYKRYFLATFKFVTKTGLTKHIRWRAESNDDSFPYAECVECIVAKYHVMPVLVCVTRISERDYENFFADTAAWKQKIAEQKISYYKEEIERL